MEVCDIRLLEPREDATKKAILLIVLTGNRGLCAVDTTETVLRLPECQPPDRRWTRTLDANRKLIDVWASVGSTG